MTTNAAPASSGFIPEIQGLRAIAVILVLLFHAKLAPFSGGYIGVDVFFVISGYLITGLLLREVERSGTISFASFYARRAKRLLPAAVTVIGITLLVGWLVYSPLEMRMATSSGISALIYLSNVKFAMSATDYLGGKAESDPFLHTWSLSVEEQFYFFWPLAILFIATRTQESHKLCYLLLITAISMSLCLYLTSVAQPFSFFLLPTRAWEFGMGASILLIGKQRFLSVHNINIILGFVGLLLLVFCGLVYDKMTLFPGYAALGPVIGTALVLLACHNGSSKLLRHLLANRVALKAGELSYSLYLWHWPVFVALFDLVETPTIYQKLAGLGISWILAQTTYSLIENPIRAKRLTTKHIYQILAITSLAFLSIALYARQAAIEESVSPSQIRFTQAVDDHHHYLSDNDCYGEYETTTAKSCSYGDGAVKVVLFGDSHAAQWIHSLREISGAYDLTIMPLVKSACPSINIQPYDENLGRVYSECTTWRAQAFKKIRDIRPDILILASSTQYWHSAVRRANFGDTTWSAALEQTLKIVEPYADKILVFNDTPLAPFRVPQCLARKSSAGDLFSRACTFPRDTKISSYIDSLGKAVSSKYAKVQHVNVARVVCPEEVCDSESNEIIHYIDSDHITGTYGRYLAPEIAKLLEENDAITLSEP